MNSTDPIADMLSRLRNAVSAGHREVSLPHSILKEKVAKILADSGFVHEVKAEGEKLNKRLVVTITAEGVSPKITEIKRLSTPGRRLYTGADDIPTVRRGRGIVIVSTSKGVMTGQAAREARLGGELICQVY